jgi:uncharacterized protein (UPF0212 family)
MRRGIPPNVIASPSCPKCGTRMTLALIVPDQSGHDRRVYECPRCEHEVSEAFALKRAS